MSKTNLFLKHLKNTNNFINNLLEKNLNKLNSKNLRFLFKNNKIILTFVALFVIFISYFLLPTFYNPSEISKELNEELQNKLDLNFKFSKNIKYNFFPTPHFTIKESKIIGNQNEISKINKLKIFISFDNLFSVKNIKVKNVILENANFNLNIKNFNFFKELLNKNFEKGNFIIKDSNVFFRNIDNEVLFISKIFKMKYYYEPKELKNFLYSENEIFNMPFSIVSFFGEDKNKIFSQINFKSIKLKINNQLSFENETRIGKSQFTIKKLKRIGEYRIERNFFSFEIYDKIDQPNVTYRGKFN